MTSVMVNGLPGKMATKVAEHIDASEDFELFGVSFGSDRRPHAFVGKEMINVFGPMYRNSGGLDAAIEQKRPDFTVDYTVPDAVNDNADFYCNHGLPFVMGTTGGDRKALEARILDSNVVAVIAPNMAKQIVALQAMFEYAAANFPGAFEGYDLITEESHQQGKKDTSGTAKAMVGYFNRLRLGKTPFDVENIRRWRDPEVQEHLIGVPREHLSGHGWHTYELDSKDGNVHFEFTHNVNGRDVYAAGTLDALRYLRRKVEAGEKGRVYSMIDVLKGE